MLVAPLLGLIDVRVGTGGVAQGAMLNSVADDSFWIKRGMESVEEALKVLDIGAKDTLTVLVPVPTPGANEAEIGTVAVS
jgi:hypothetical protein